MRHPNRLTGYAALSGAQPGRAVFLGNIRSRSMGPGFGGFLGGDAPTSVSFTSGTTGTNAGTEIMPTTVPSVGSGGGGGGGRFSPEQVFNWVNGGVQVLRDLGVNVPQSGPSGAGNQTGAGPSAYTPTNNRPPVMPLGSKARRKKSNVGWYVVGGLVVLGVIGGAAVAMR